jgi:hypothetical protein
MAFFDFLSGVSPSTPMATPTVDNLPDVESPTPTFRSRFGDFFRDPENIAMMANLGSALSSPGLTTGQAIGTATSEALRSRALRKLYEKESRRQSGLLSFLGGDLSGLLSPKGDLGGADAVNITDDKITITAPNPRRMQRDTLTETPLESMRRQTDVGF